MRGGYQVCGWSLCRRTPIAVHFSWILQITDLLQGNSSFSYPKMGICRSSRSELDLTFQGSGNSLRLSIFPLWIEGVSLPPPYLLIFLFIINFSSLLLWKNFSSLYIIVSSLLSSFLCIRLYVIFHQIYGEYFLRWFGKSILQFSLLLYHLLIYHHHCYFFFLAINQSYCFIMYHYVFYIIIHLFIFYFILFPPFEINILQLLFIFIKKLCDSQPCWVYFFDVIMNSSFSFN